MSKFRTGTGEFVSLTTGDMSGMVPVGQSGSGTADASKFLRGDGAWAVPPGGGEAFPVGSVFIGVVSTNPNTLLGYGTWSAFGAGRVMVGLNSGDTDFDTVEETGGAKTVAAAGSNSAPTVSGSTATEGAHTHSVTSNVTVADHASHTHDIASQLATPDLFTSNTAASGVSGRSGGPSATLTHSPTNNAVTSGAGTSHSHAAGTLAASAPTFTGSATSIVQPYIVCYFWKRVG